MELRIQIMSGTRILLSFINSIFLVCFDDKIWHSVVGLKNETLVSKRKKRKKESPLLVEMTNENGGRHDRLKERNEH
jgi:hypothetical protein